VSDKGHEKDREGQDRTARDRMSDGFNRGLGVLSAFKEALEETIAEARERGDLSADRAREAMKSAVERARSTATDARERFDFVSAAEFEALEARVRRMERHLGIGRAGEEGARKEE
jgi:polyhydroxyalkanoate synthesis regulator phasin